MYCSLDSFFSRCLGGRAQNGFFLIVVVEVDVFTTSGLSQVCNPWLAVSKGMFPIRRVSPQILMALDYCGCQLALNLGSVAPAYHDEDGAIPTPEACKYILKYDWRPDWRFVVWGGTWILGSLCEKGKDVCEELRKMVIDMCCVQEVRWREQGASMMGMEGRRYIVVV